MDKTTSCCPASQLVEAMHKQVFMSTSVHANKTGKMIKMTMYVAKRFDLQLSRDVVVWRTPLLA